MGGQSLPDSVTTDARVLDSEFLISSSIRSCRMSRPSFQATPPEYAGHLIVENSAAGHPIGKTPIETYFMVSVRTAWTLCSDRIVTRT